jgi:hypothetical protein
MGKVKRFLWTVLDETRTAFPIIIWKIHKWGLRVSKILLAQDDNFDCWFRQVTLALPIPKWLPIEFYRPSLPVMLC